MPPISSQKSGGLTWYRDGQTIQPIPYPPLTPHLLWPNLVVIPSKKTWIKSLYLCFHTLKRHPRYGTLYTTDGGWGQPITNTIHHHVGLASPILSFMSSAILYKVKEIWCKPAKLYYVIVKTRRKEKKEKEKKREKLIKVLETLCSHFDNFLSFCGKKKEKKRAQQHQERIFIFFQKKVS